MSAAAIAELAKIAAEKKSEAAAKRDQSKKRRQDKYEAESRDTIIAFGACKKQRKAGCGAQQPLPVKREPVVEESMGPPPPPPPLPEHISNGDEVRCCGFLWIASVASRL